MSAESYLAGVHCEIVFSVVGNEVSFFASKVTLSFCGVAMILRDTGKFLINKILFALDSHNLLFYMGFSF